MSYTDQELTEWKRTINAAAVLSSRMELTQQSNEWVGLCPYHKESTPSFHVYMNDSSKQWDCHCHGACGRSWNLFQVVQKLDKLDFKSAVEKVLSQVGWEAGKAIADQTFTTVLQEEKVLRTYPVSVLKAAQDALLYVEAPRQWLGMRGIFTDTAAELGLGYIQSAAAVSPNHPWVDKGWIVIPTIEKGTITCLKYRSLFAKKSEDGKISGILRGPKMLTSLYNLNNLSPMDDVYVVEGEPDVWAMHQAGFIAVAYPSIRKIHAMTSRKRRDRPDESQPHLPRRGQRYGGRRRDGNKLWAELRDRVFRIRWPQGIKDANDFLVKTCEGVTDVFQVEVEKLRDKALRLPSPISLTLNSPDVDERRLYAAHPEENPLRLRFRNEES